MPINLLDDGAERRHGAHGAALGGRTDVTLDRD
jgi:hypothetical protein